MAHIMAPTRRRVKNSLLGAPPSPNHASVALAFTIPHPAPFPGSHWSEEIRHARSAWPERSVGQRDPRRARRGFASRIAHILEVR